MKERIQPPYLDSLAKLTTVFHETLPQNLLPCYPARPYPSIFESLLDAARQAPSLNTQIASIAKAEAIDILNQNQKVLSPLQTHKINTLLEQLPDIDQEHTKTETIEPHELFLLHHDLHLTTLQNKVALHHLRYNLQFPKFDQALETIMFHGILSWHYEWYRHHAQEIDNPMLIASYATLTRLFSRQAVLPAIQEALSENLPMGNFELFEARSCYREFAQLPPTTFAQSFKLKSAIEEFVRMRQFHDKNSHLPVEVEFDPRSTDPLVYMDIGDIYRMVRNLLRDAVTHSQAKVIRPVILIGEKPDHVCLSILSQGNLDEQTLGLIGRVPYTTQDQGDKPHGYGKVSARRLITQLWADLGLSIGEIESLMKDHWSNVLYHQAPHVRWTAPLPAVK